MIYSLLAQIIFSGYNSFCNILFSLLFRFKTKYPSIIIYADYYAKVAIIAIIAREGKESE